jgi:hypothetical protein
MTTAEPFDVPKQGSEPGATKISVVAADLRSFQTHHVFKWWSFPAECHNHAQLVNDVPRFKRYPFLHVNSNARFNSDERYCG